MQNMAPRELFAQQVHISRIQSLISEYHPPEKQLELLEELEYSGSPAKYQYRVLDHLTRRINNSTGTVSDELSEAHAQALISCMVTGGQMGNSTSGGPTPVIYRFLNHEVTIVEERDTLAKAGGTGYRTWEAALALGDYLVNHPLPEKSVIELGAGTGFVSRLLTQLGYQTLSTDGDPAILENIKELKSTSLWWDTKETPELLEFTKTLPFKEFVLVAADVLYDPNNYAPFLFTVSKLLAYGRYALVATTMRNQDTYALLSPECDRLGLEITHIASYNAGASSKYFYLNDEVVEIVKLTLANSGS